MPGSMLLVKSVNKFDNKLHILKKEDSLVSSFFNRILVLLNIQSLV